MTEQELEILLYRGESESLDFKRDQYEFFKAGDDQKGELLKDLLAFANAWRTEPAHIVLGVEEQPRPHIVGIPVSAHLDDHSLQQFVNAKTNRPVRLSYHRVEYRGLHVGVIRLEHPQQRPAFLNKRFGPLDARTVYIRRGSSTDIASPDEVFAMGRAEVESQSTPVIRLEFAEPGREVRLGDQAIVACTRLLVRPPGEETQEPTAGEMSLLSREIILAITGGVPNDDWKVKAAYIAEVSGLTALRFWLFNDSTVNATDVRVRIEVPETNGLTIVDDGHHPRWDSLPIYARFVRARDSFGEPEVTKAEGGWRIEVRLPKLQPRSEYYTGPFYVRANRELSIQVPAQVFADNLPEPIPAVLQLGTLVEEKRISFSDAERLLRQLTK